MVCAFLLYYACRVLWRAVCAGNRVYESFVFPEWYLYTLAPPVFLLLLALYLRRLRRGPGIPAVHEPPRESVF